MTTENTEWLTIKEAAEATGVTTHAISSAICRNRLKAQGFCNPHRWLIDPKQLEEYIKSKYSRGRSKEEYSVKQAAKILGITEQKVYYAARIGRLKASRKGTAWVIRIEDIQEFQKKYLSWYAKRL